MRFILRAAALTPLLFGACAGWVGWGYGWCDYYDPYCYDYHYDSWAPGAVAAGDFDDDGKLDLAVADVQSGNVWVLRGEDGGGFAPVPTASLGLTSASAQVAVLRANDDARPDLLVLDGSPGLLSVYVGDGSGGFAPAPPALNAALVPSVMCFARGPINDDGFDDLVFVDQDARVHVALGTGVGTFADVGLGDPAAEFLGPDAAARLPGIHVSLAVFDGQPGTDLLIMDGARSQFAVLSGSGDGTFGAARTVSFRSLGDVLDLAPVFAQSGNWAGLAVLFCDRTNASSTSTLVVLRLSDGGFETAPVAVDSTRAIVARDLDGDGATDLLLSDEANRNIRTLHARGL